jgi:hypothetical protein
MRIENRGTKKPQNAIDGYLGNCHNSPSGQEPESMQIKALWTMLLMGVCLPVLGQQASCIAYRHGGYNEQPVSQSPAYCQAGQPANCSDVPKNNATPEQATCGSAPAGINPTAPAPNKCDAHKGPDQFGATWARCEVACPVGWAPICTSVPASYNGSPQCSCRQQAKAKTLDSIFIPYLALEWNSKTKTEKETQPVAKK